jgi:phosphoglycolate phosphatase-like HAD superfamily hydrolase
MARTVAVDLDGVVHRYSRGWADGTIYDPPVDGAYEALLRLATAGWRLVLHTTRARDPAQAAAVAAWLEINGMAGLFAEVTDRKPLAVAYIDDRAIRFTDWPQALAELAEKESRP